MRTLVTPRNAVAILALLLAAVMAPLTVSAAPNPALILETVRKAPATVVALNGESVADIKVVREWTGSLCRARLVNEGKTSIKVKEVVLCEVLHSLPPETQFYGEGFTMLSQTTGTLGKPSDMGLTDRKHYKIPQPANATVVYGLLTLHPPDSDQVVMAFTSCRRFLGRFYVYPKSIQVVLDTEGLTLEPGDKWELEEFQFQTGTDRNALLTAVGERIARNHPRLRSETVPTGWCSWYCFGSRVKAAQVLSNVDFMAKELPALKYILIDDGYQPAMGDWLETGPAFGGGVQQVLKKIRDKKFEAALWVAPFIAEKDSKLFQQHPDWFIHDADGKPLSADKVTFQGWRRGPWYALDATHPEAQKHLENLFRTLHKEWGVTCFKLDANFWGAMHGGHFHDPKATRIEAYRRGMEALRRGSGDAFLIGCNHPIWPSFGEIHGSRSSGDIKRAWNTFAGTARMNLSRNWQNGRLWWNDPDCVLLTGDLSADEYQFHATVVYATGGMLLSGDDLTTISEPRLAMLRKLLPPTGVPAEFEDDALRVGFVRLPGRTVVCVLNWDEKPQTLSVKLSGTCKITDYWTGTALGEHAGTFEVKELAKHSARLLVCEPVSPK